MEIIHHATPEQVEALAEVFAMPLLYKGVLIWVMPKWWDVMYQASGAKYE